MGNTAHFARKAVALLGLVLNFLPAQLAYAQSCVPPDSMRATQIDRHFTQKKYFPGMSAALQSQGRITAREDEIVWHMMSPFDVKTIITSQGISQSVDNGPVQPINTGSTGMGVGMARSMAAIMRGQWNDLKSFFDVSAITSPQDGAWVVTLKPMDHRLQSVMGTISVKGCVDVDGVTIERSKGDYEIITFDEIRSSTQAKTP